jgi:hypothetical protein
VPRLVVVSIGYFLLGWAGRNYRAHRHLHVVNTHRWNALETFGAFVKQTDDKAIKDAVLLEATHCVFGASVTGYLGPDENTPLPPGADLLKSLTQK